MIESIANGVAEMAMNLVSLPEVIGKGLSDLGYQSYKEMGKNTGVGVKSQDC